MPEKKSRFFTPELARQALTAAEACILALFNSKVSAPERPFIHMVILGNDGKIIAEQTIGRAPEGEDFEDQCRKIARSKAEIHFRTGRSSKVVQERAPHLLSKFDTIYGGSAEFEDIIVAGSGVEEYFDEAISNMVAGLVWAFCKKTQANFRYANQAADWY